MHFDQQNNHSQPDMSDSFNYFSRLPAEIRSMIWEYSLPEGRVYEVLDAPNAKQKTPAQEGLMFANVHPEPPPALAAVCRESRYFVLHHYKPLTLGTTTKYVDLSRDMLLLEPYLLIKRLHRALHFMSKIPLVRDNINRLALGTSYGVYTGICHPVLNWKVSKNSMGKLLSSLSLFPKLKMLIFVVHQEFQFEFDFRFPGSLSGPLSAPAVNLSSAPPPPPPSFNHPMFGASSLTAPSAPALAPAPSGPGALLPRPQLVHQAYRFKFDIEANINHSPRRPHMNELLYYPLDIDEDRDDWDMDDLDDGNEWCDPWPTNDDWRRFRRRFQRAMHLSLEMNQVAPPQTGRKGCGGAKGASAGTGSGAAQNHRYAGRPETRQQQRMALPALKGASLLWRYTRGGYV
jgi:hypothetical protein